jgi:hypothetical protein
MGSVHDPHSGKLVSIQSWLPFAALRLRAFALKSVLFIRHPKSGDSAQTHVARLIILSSHHSVFLFWKGEREKHSACVTSTPPCSTKATETTQTPTRHPPCY